MQLNFKYLNLHTEYSAEGPIPHEMQRKPCYGTISGALRTHDGPLTQTYHIRVYNTPHKLKESANNFCFVDIPKYLDLLKQIIDFSYDLTDEPDEHRVVLNITISNKKGTFHNYILTSIRPLYEHPYNFALHDAMKLYDSGDCPGLTIVDCFNLCLASGSIYIGGGHTIAQDNTMLLKPMSIKEINNSSMSGTMLNYWYPKVCRKINEVTINNSDHIENIINKYYKRHSIYLSNYNELMRHV